MPEIAVGAQIFDVVFHPKSPIVYTGLLTGHIKAFAYDEQGNSQPIFSVRPSKRSCRGLSINENGSKLYAVGKAKTLNVIDVTTASIDTRAAAHDCAINRVKCLMPWLLVTGDDDGMVKLWDTRQPEAVNTYTQHFDYISDFLWLADKKQLIATSGDGTLSVMDVRSKKPEPLAQSEDQEDELLSIVAIKGSTKVLVGTQLGIISVFNRQRGWADCVDRIPGHPLSVDALCNIPADVPNVDATSTVLTGSSDGFVRAVQILPTKLLGVVADHGEFPVERIAIGGGVGQLGFSQQQSSATGQSLAEEAHSTRLGSSMDVDQEAEMEVDLSRPRRWWVGSVGHEDVLRMTDLEGFFQNTEGKDEWKGVLDVGAQDVDSDIEDEAGEDDLATMDIAAEISSSEGSSSEEEDDRDERPLHVKRTRQDPSLNVKHATKNEAVVDKGFFDGL